ncbi:GerAB/ArcD/ProY family transporter [Paenibacillus thalictri]|uniref:Uncharacterized protein n=1 Tax=Paenibacillus thalictri TaxID=2527873 RepID=A0A4Q9DN38_9BACL|nr:GerAB/ArcD/ProY family transporter [Paenibacillus thalictri]TBL75697.1 hypothetical protein EYB31_22145 [Paenibacillus thalictri]
MQRINQLQVIIFFVMFHFSTFAGFMISPLTKSSSYQGWLVMILAMAGGLIVTYISYSLAKLRPGEFLAHYGKKLVGKWPHYAIMVLYCFFFLHLSSIIVRQISDFLVQTFLPTTPLWVVAGMFSFLVAIAVRSGFEVIFRCASGFFIVIISSAALVPFMVGKELNYNRAIAFITHLDAGSLWNPVITFIPWFGEMFLILFIFPFLAEPEKTYRSVMWSMLISLIFIEIDFILCLLMFGADVTGHFSYPMLEMVRFIRIGDFLENLDPLLVTIWISSVFIKVSLLLYMVLLITSQLLGLKDSRPLSFSFSAIMLVMAIHNTPNSTMLEHFIMKTWPVFAMLVECSPLIYWAVQLFKKSRMTRQQD